MATVANSRVAVFMPRYRFRRVWASHPFTLNASLNVHFPKMPEGIPSHFSDLAALCIIHLAQTEKENVIH